MPIKLWDKTNGQLTSAIALRGSGKGSVVGEARRPDAEALDAEVDAMLDLAAAHVLPSVAPANLFLARRWAIGRAIQDSRLMESPNLELGEQGDLWLAIDRKCRLGIRADGRAEDAWHRLVPGKENDPARPDRDPFPVSLWLQEQDLDGTIAAFGGRYGNAQKLFMRPALRSRNLREAVAAWMRCQPDDKRKALANNKRFWGVIRALAARFPSRGPGSAKRPVHYAPDELYAEVSRVLDPIAAEITQPY